MNDMLRELAAGSRDLAGKLGVQIIAMKPGRDHTILRKLQARFISLAKDCEAWSTDGD